MNNNTLPKWDESREEQLKTYIGSETPVSVETVDGAAELLQTTSRSIGQKLRRMGYEVAVREKSKRFTDMQEEVLRELVVSNSGKFTIGEIAEKYENGAFTSQQLMGKLLSMELMEHLRKTPPKEVVHTYTEAETERFVDLCKQGATIEDLAEAFGREIASIRGKALSLLRAGSIEAIPVQETKKGEQPDLFDGVDVTNLTVEQLAEQLERTERGIKTMLTRRGLKALNYDGEARKAKASA